MSEQSETPDGLWAEIHRLRAAIKGPDGYESWRDAAVAEKLKRVGLERELSEVTKEGEGQTEKAIFWEEETKRWKREYDGCLIHAVAAERELDELRGQVQTKQELLTRVGNLLLEHTYTEQVVEALSKDALASIEKGLPCSR